MKIRLFARVKTMMFDQFLYCRICNEVHHITPFDSAPIYDLDLNGMTVREIFTDDHRQFADRHFGHEVEQLKSVTENHFSIGRLVDPMKAGYAEVSNGQESFILRISRRCITEPVSYKIVSRQMMPWEVTNEGREEGVPR
jgi:hypothetical protein